MGQILHGCATTTEAVRRAIQNSQESVRTLAQQYNINPKTVAKWKRRSHVQDAPMGPKQGRSCMGFPPILRPQFTGSMMPGSFGVEEWKGMSRALKAGIPDLSYNFRIVDADETTARVSSQLSGTHTQNLDLSAMDMGVIPPTNVAFTCGEEFSVGQARDGKIVSIHLEQGPDRGMFDMLRQIGVEVPQM